MKHVSLLAAALLLSACATVPTDASSPTSGAALEGDLELGDWRSADQATMLAAFQQHVESRYGAGIALSDAVADLRSNDFNCGDAPTVDEQGRGDPPAQVCRRTATANNCTHTWQVHLFETTDARIARTRGLYDRRCGNEGLLGGPG